MRSNKILLACFFMLAAQTSSYAAHYGMAGCGLGSMIFADDPGKVQQIVAATTNSAFYQTSAISSGTSNCFESGNTTAATELFIEVNKVAIEKDISRGQGETITRLAELYKCDNANTFGTALQKNYGTIFPKVDTTTGEVVSGINSTIKSESALGCKVTG